MASTLNRSSFRLFGLDLAAAPGFLRDGWVEALGWPAFRWLTPDEPVRLIHADGSESVRRGVSTQTLASAGRVRFAAVELAEDSVLRRSLVLPRLTEEETRRAIELDVQAASPFAEEDLAWGYVTKRNDRVHVDIALTSRRLIGQQLDAHLPRLGGVTPEVWVGGERPFVIAGYGESERLAYSRRKRVALFMLLAIAAGLLAGLLATPSLQLRERALEATQRYEQLSRAVTPQVKMRDELVKLAEQVRLLAKAADKRFDVVALLDQVTRQLPDDVVLNRFEIGGGIVRISGQADNAAQLLQTLGANPAFRDVRAPAGIARAPAGGKEGFTIEFGLAAEAKTS
jgi:general secretion pathway protein L